MRPAITIDPAVRFGYPHIRGIPTDAIAGMVWAGETPEVVCEDYGITRYELLLACWYEASYRPVAPGKSAYRQAWARWAKDVFQLLALGAATELIPTPPDKDGGS